MTPICCVKESEGMLSQCLWCWGGYMECADDPCSYVAQSYTDPFSVGEITEHMYSGCPYGINQYYRTVQDGDVHFIKHGPAPETQQVVFQFLDFGLTPTYGPPALVDPSMISYRGAQGFWHNGNVSFIVPIRMGIEYVIRESDFCAPKLAREIGYGYGVFANERGHWVRFAGITNEVLSVQLECDKAVNTPKKFEFGKTDLESPCGKKPEEAEALIVYFSQAFNYITRQIEDFDVALRVLPNGVPGIQWSKASGPSSGTLVDSDQAQAAFRNPKQGGVYRFDAAVRGDTVPTQLWLPLAGPDITQWFEDELAWLDTAGEAYIANCKMQSRIVFDDLLVRISEFGVAAAGADWLGQFTSAHGPCGGPVTLNVHDARHTLGGVVVERHKLSGVLIAYLARKITPLSESRLIKFFYGYGTPDDSHANAAYQAGFDIFAGVSVEAAMQARGHSMQAPGSWAAEEWPNLEPATGGAINRPTSVQLLLGGGE